MGIIQADRLIVASSSWHDLWKRLTSGASKDAAGTKLKGDVFERLTQLYLLAMPEYRTILRHVWRANDELPKNVRRHLGLPHQDVGIDLIAKTKDGEYWAIQCKFRSDQSSPLTYTELSTFSHLSFVTCHGVALALVVHTTSKPIRKKKLLRNTTEIGLERWLALTDDEWGNIRTLCQHKPLKLEPRNPRPHQKSAIAAASKHFVTDRQSRGRLIMPCGTGKSLTAFWIAEALKPKSILVAVPSLALIRQSLNDWTREFLANGIVPEWLCVCSDETTGNLDQDEFLSGAYDLGIPTTTNQAVIAAFLRRRGNGHKIIFTTYQSSPRLAKAAKLAKYTFDLAILDEAHKTVGVKGKSFATLLFDKNIAVRQRLFMTATERVLKGDNDDVLSMDNEATYGRRFFLMTFKEAIAQKVICDYKIITMTVSSDRLRQIISQNRILNLDPDNLDEAEAQAVAAGVALKSVYKKQKIKHAISFHRSIRSADGFREQQDALNELTEIGPRSVNLHISSKKTAGERAHLMKDFTGHSRALMTNARCLTEGVDVPAIDCVLFADPKQSVIDIVQASGRALRRYEGKKYGYILVPLVVPGNMTFDDFAETTAFRQVARVITSLSTQDERIAEEFRALQAGRKPSGSIVEITGDVPVGMKMPLVEFAEAISSQVWERVGPANWRPFEEARAFVQQLHLKSQTDWFEYSKLKSRPKDIPTTPSTVYQGKGWASWGDWVGTGTIASQSRIYRPFKKARLFARGLGLKSRAQWTEFALSGRLPKDIPAIPAQVYKAEWLGVGDWLGTGAVASQSRMYRSFKKARAFARSLNLKSATEWRNLSKSGELPKDIPSGKPYKIYKDRGWIGWGDWLGTMAVATNDRSYRPFEKARAFAHGLQLKSAQEWFTYAKSGKLPRDIPASARKVYRNSGWAGFRDWLGTGM